MVVIIEGIDGTGKTTLCNEIIKKSNYQYIKGSYTKSSEEKHQRLYSLFEQIFDDNVIYLYDRITAIDDFVYNFLNDEEPEFNQYQDIIKAILNHCIIIHVTVDEETRYKRFTNRGDDYITQDMIETISKNYTRFYKDFGCMVYLFPLSSDTDKDSDKIIQLINKCK